VGARIRKCKTHEHVLRKNVADEPQTRLELLWYGTKEQGAWLVDGIKWPEKGQLAYVMLYSSAILSFLISA
jgi:hypothetical protein